MSIAKAKTVDVIGKELGGYALGTQELVSVNFGMVISRRISTTCEAEARETR